MGAPQSAGASENIHMHIYRYDHPYATLFMLMITLFVFSED